MLLEERFAVQVALAAGIGLLVGLERERRDDLRRPAGTRTMPIVAVLGALTQHFRPDLVWLMLTLVAVYIGIAYVAKVRQTETAGLTTSFTTILVFLLGVLTTHSVTGVRAAVVVGAGLTAILAARKPMHEFAGLIRDEDRVAMAKFLVVALVILPLLPDEPLDVLLGLDLRFAWLMVVFVSAIDLAGYLLSRWLGTTKGMGFTGLVGGVVSSTATTVSLSRRVADDESLTRVAAGAIALAGLMTVPRVLVLVLVVDPGLLPTAALGLGVMSIGMVLGVAWIVWRMSRHEVPEVRLSNPFRLGPALVFGAFFAIVLVLTRYLSATFGDLGVYLSAVFGSLVGTEAITISLARLSVQEVSQVTAVRALVIAVAVNHVAKQVLVGSIGTARLAGYYTVATAGAVLGAAAAFFVLGI